MNTLPRATLQILRFAQYDSSKSAARLNQISSLDKGVLISL